MSKIGSAITQKTDIPSLSTEIATDIYTRYKGGESAKDMFENPETNFYWKHIMDDYIEACGYDNWTDWKTNYPNKDTESEE